MLPWFLELAFLVDPQTLVITFPSVLPHHPPFIIIATIPLVPTALGACLCNWTEAERWEQACTLTVFDRVNLSKLVVVLFSVVGNQTELTIRRLLLILSQGLLEMERLTSSDRLFVRRWSFYASSKRLPRLHGKDPRWASITKATIKYFPNTHSLL